MRVMLFGATGMVGQGVLRECLLDPDVVAVLAVGRAATGQRHPKLHDLVHPDMLDLPPMPGYDACFFCLGVSSAGMDEELALAREGAPTRVLETVDIAALAFRPPGQEPESRPRNPR